MAEIAWPPERRPCAIDWHPTEWGEGTIRFYGPDRSLARLLISANISPEGVERDGENVWQVRIDPESVVTIEPSIHMEGHWHSPRPVQFQLVECLGRRRQSVEAIEQPGDYYGPVTGYTGPGLEACFFLLPNAHADGAQPGQRSIHHVTFPPHTYRECDDGSLEIRASIGARPYWHGYLDEGHVWRTVPD